MSKVYSFRLSDENPREVQAMQVIDTWISKGYPLRYLVTKALLNYDGKDHQNGEYKKELEKITKLLDTLLKGHAIVDKTEENNATLSESFIGSISQVVKPGMKMND